MFVCCYRNRKKSLQMCATKKNAVWPNELKMETNYFFDSTHTRLKHCVKMKKKTFCLHISHSLPPKKKTSINSALTLNLLIFFFVFHSLNRKNSVSSLIHWKYFYTSIKLLHFHILQPFFSSTKKMMMVII